MRRKVTCVLLICATVAIMGVIFWFSSQPAAESFQQSRMFAGWLAEMLPVAEPEAFMEDIHHLLRKLAHFMLYAALGLRLSGIEKVSSDATGAFRWHFVCSI